MEGLAEGVCPFYLCLGVLVCRLVILVLYNIMKETLLIMDITSRINRLQQFLAVFHVDGDSWRFFKNLQLLRKQEYQF